MRGKLPPKVGFKWELRITPAHAGKTQQRLRAGRLVEDHPRACGENMLKPCPFCGSKGSPPRMRGKPTRYTANICMSRITPAHAGKTDYAQPAFATEEDHPRACGENEKGKNCESSREGSPPRMRGKPDCSAASICRMRITPAHAGKTSRMSRRRSGTKDHPRACGENISTDCVQIAMTGSPPRMRGKPATQHRVGAGGWITPAHAGKTGVFLSSGVCVTGSPPRMRGKQNPMDAKKISNRITPAHAGKTCF